MTMGQQSSQPAENGAGIGDYALLSDCRSAALVHRNGSVDWLCFPRFDSPSVFGRLLDSGAGHFSIQPRGTFSAQRRYLEQTLVLETTFQTDTGTATLHDALAVGPNERGHALGQGAPHVLVRSLTCVKGQVELELELAARLEYGLTPPAIHPMNRGRLLRGGGGVLVFSADATLSEDRSVLRSQLSLREGESRAFALEYAHSWQAIPDAWTAQQVELCLRDTAESWRTWSGMHQAYEGPWKELVHSSGRVLQALTFAPTGAIVAAPTTSLPESVGGARNWDYRFTWLRDASLTLDALWVAACPDEAHRFYEFIADAVRGDLQDGKPLQVMLGVAGEHDLTERELPHLAGWRRSRPVRVGNAAWMQRQLDVYGELLAAAHRLAPQLKQLSPRSREFLASAADLAAERWMEPDHGIWEVRNAPRHFLYSKLMCWVALDRAVALVELLHAEERVERWERVRAQIRDAILERGWSERAQAFTQSFDSDVLDASSLIIPMVGFLPGDDPRVLATVRSICERLTDSNGLVFRYRGEDGLAGDEGTFLLCTFWLAQAQALGGDLGAATATFNRAAAFVNDVGLLAEEVDPSSGELLGNFPQAFSHIGLINAAWSISQGGRA